MVGGMERFIKALRPPPFEKWKKPIKGAIAILISLVFTFDNTCRAAIGSASLLVSISVVLYFPSRTFGVVLEDVVLGTLGALIGVGYSCLGMFLANLARESTNPFPVQKGSSGVLAAFLVIATFILNYIRLKVPRANFAGITATIFICFTLTQASVIPGFYPELLWMFMKPLALGGAIVLGVSALIWPDDSMSNYLGVLLKCLDGHSTFFKEHSDAFLSLSPTSLNTTLPSLHDRLQGSTLLLIDCKRAVHRDILYSRLSGKDTSKLTQMVKDMRNPLHGIGLCQILKGDFDRKFQKEEKGDSSNGSGSEDSSMIEKEMEAEKKALFDAIGELHSILEQLSDACHDTLNDCVARLKGFHGASNRTTLNSILWPFPRLFSSMDFIDQKKRSSMSKKKKFDEEKQEYTDLPYHAESQQLKSLIDRLNQQASQSVSKLWSLHPEKPLKRHVGALNLFSTYRYHLTEYAKHLATFVEFVEELESTRSKRRLWMPSVKSVKKYFRAGEMDPHMQSGEIIDNEQANNNTAVDLVRTQTRQNSIVDPESASTFALRKEGGKLYFRDPDVDPPTTPMQRMFYKLYLVRNWFLEPDTFLSFKTTIGTILLALPVFLPHSAAWYITNHGQWAMIILMMWMFPMSGMFFYTVIMRVLGTVCGGVLGIVVWEIAQGNPYGLAVVTTVVAIFCYYCLLYKAPLRMLAIMTLITLVMIICYEYQFVADNTGSDAVWTLAGKRMLLVIIGVVAAAILSMIPAPVNGRVELRKRLSQTLRDIGRLYSLLSSQFLIPHMPGDKPSDAQVKSVRRLAFDLQRQIADERTFLKLAVFEPPLRGTFPSKTYGTIIEGVNNMVDLIYDMAFSIRNLDPSWRYKVALSATRERKDYYASLLTTLKLLSSTMAAKMALPPYMLSPKEAMDRYSESLYENFRITDNHLSNPSFLNYSAYLVSSVAFVDELQKVLSAVEDLVGIEDPIEWMKIHTN
ncbi:hypothetical protein BDA99DRAFT_563757 [Phascolomyces articulosus]|uniref:ER transporter 6TM N-terminal domain-containing protein n=1 Tax=Phascolomyces articulosus TaxID=60185 RepID=A0AAD5K1Z2_9FUNG|nr:hypothetical protein BDA99DRAFT_563757 [Phascolomyces articulosus]